MLGCRSGSAKPNIDSKLPGAAFRGSTDRLRSQKQLVYVLVAREDIAAECRIVVHRFELAQFCEHGIGVRLERRVKCRQFNPGWDGFRLGFFGRHGLRSFATFDTVEQGLSYQIPMTPTPARCYDAHMPLLNVFDYEELARQKLSQPFFDYIAGGADDEVTLRRNRGAFESIELRPRALVDVSKVDLSTTVLGERIEMPVLLAPVAVQRLAHPEGELASARAAAAAGTIMTLSTMASASIEEVAAASDGPKWFQLYVHPERNVSKRMVQRAEAAGYKAICLTVDVPRLGRRERDFRNRFDYPPGVAHRNYIGEVELPPLEIEAGQSALNASADVLIDPSLTWDVIDWLRSFTSLPVIVKGIMTAEDAQPRRRPRRGSDRRLQPRRPPARRRARHHQLCCRRSSRPFRAGARCCWTAESAAARTS